jgi:hypothetical protein
MRNFSKHRKLKELVELRKQHARNMNKLHGLTQKQIADKYLHKIYATKNNQQIQHATEALGHFNSEGNFINAPIGITTTGVWNNTRGHASLKNMHPFAHAVKFVPSNNFKIPNVRTRRKKHIQHAVSKFNVTKYLKPPLAVMVESTNSASSKSKSKSRSRSRSRSKSASPKPYSPNLAQIEKDKAKRANFLAKMKKQ